MAISESVPQKVQKPIRDGVYVHCQYRESTGDTRFFAEVGRDVWVTKWFAGRLTLQAASKAWVTQQHLFNKLDAVTCAEYWKAREEVDN